VEARNEKLFAQEHAIPMKVIRYGGTEGKLVGCVSLTPRVAKAVVELGYYLHPEKGIMAIAASAVLKWAKDVFGVRRVYSRYVLGLYNTNFDMGFGKGVGE
jgi:RimJ/RimL family protein N-acetyltransferase